MTIQDRIPISEAGEGVDVAIGIVAFKRAVFQPEKAFDAETICE